MITLYFGPPGCGKSTMAAKLIKKAPRLYDHVYSNFLCAGARYFNAKDIGTFQFPEHSLVIIDEAGIEFNNRQFKSFGKDLVYFFKMHRHYKIDIVLFSQSWEDTDITIRRLAVDLYNMKKVGNFSISRRVKMYVGLDEQTHQLVDAYEFYHLWAFWNKPLRFCYRPFYYHCFDSFQHPPINPIPFTELPDRRLSWNDRLKIFARSLKPTPTKLFFLAGFLLLFKLISG